MGVKEILKEYAKTFERPYEALETRFNELLASVDATKDEGVRRTIAMSKLTGEVKREEGITQKTVNYVGIVLGATEPEDSIEKTRNISLAIYNKNKERAVREGYTNEDGVVLDRRDKVLGRANPNKGLQLEGEDWRRIVVGLNRRENEEGYRFFTLRYYGGKYRNLVDATIPKFTTTKFRAIEKLAGNERMTMNAAKGTKWTEIDEPIDIVGELERLNLIVEPNNAEEWYQVNKKVRDAVLICRGCITSIRRELNDFGTRGMVISNIRNARVALRLTIRGDIPEELDEDSHVIIFGKPRLSGSTLWVDTLGIYPLPDENIPPLAMEGDNGV